MDPWSPKPCFRTATLFSETSFSPTISMYGTFFTSASLILRPIFSSLSSIKRGLTFYGHRNKSFLIGRLLDLPLGPIPEVVFAHVFFFVGRIAQRYLSGIIFKP